MVFLITTWFGCFLFNDKKVLEDKIIFPNDIDKLSSIFEKIESNQILPEEKKIITKHKNIIVSQKRLQKFGEYKPEHPFFKSIKLNHQDYGFSIDVLHNISQNKANNKIQQLLNLPDHQIIQMVHAIDDLIQTSNLFMERISTWSVFPVSKDSIDPLKVLQKQTDSEIDRLQVLIKNEMENLAPNTTDIVSPLIGARLIAHAGSLEKLAKLPASSIQLLGAEKALFRFKKEGGKPPKHGVIFQHSIINKAPRKFRGKFARILALKISIAIKADVYTKRDISEELKNNLNNQINQCLKN